ncbi:GntR family transcriptional regulator [bacterium]|nr:MAG: GntR family transcriptional regulator [bacterium]
MRRGENMDKELLMRHRINRDLPVPYYYQIVEILRVVIRDMEVESDVVESLPSEVELCEIYQVNRGTIRHALDALEREGLIYREKGRGTFIRRKRYEIDLLHFNSTTEELLARGHVPSTRVLSTGVINPDLHMQKSLWLTANDPVWQLYRLRLADGEPISLQWSHVPVALAPDIDQKDLTGSLYQILKTDYQIVLTSGDQIIRARMATPEESELLQIKAGDPVIEISRVSYDQNEEPVEYMDSLWRADRYDMRVHLSSEGF